MKILNLLSSGGTGGIEKLCEDIFQTSQYDNYFAFMFENGEIFERLEKKNKDKVLSLTHLHGKLFKIIKFLNTFIKNNNIDIVVVHHGTAKCNIIFLALMKKNKKVKFVRYLHGCYDNYSWSHSDNFINNIIIDKIMKYTLLKSSSIISISNASKDSFVDALKIADNKFNVIYNGISDNFYNNRIKKTFNSDTLKFVYVGRLEYIKGLDNFLNVLSQLKNNIKFSFDIVGDGSYRSYLETKVNEYKLSENIKFYGTQKNVIAFLDKNDFFIYPSICQEGLGISVIESIARGCIPIVSNRGGLPEVVANNQSLIFDDLDELKKIVLYLYNLNRKEKIEISNFYLEFSERFKIRNTIEKIEDIYNDLIDKS